MYFAWARLFHISLFGALSNLHLLVYLCTVIVGMFRY